MAGARQKTGKYSQLIQKSDADIQAEQLDLNVGTAQNQLQQGILQVKAKVLEAKGKVKSAEIDVQRAERELEAAKAGIPFDVQAILDARVAKKKAEKEQSKVQAEQAEYEATETFLAELEKELF